MGGIFCEPIIRHTLVAPTWTICGTKQILNGTLYFHILHELQYLFPLMSFKFSVLVTVGKLLKRRVSNALEESWHQRPSLSYEVFMIREIQMVFSHVVSLICKFHRITIVICLTSPKTVFNKMTTICLKSIKDQMMLNFKINSIF